ncbi:hypothetical protein DEO72_LG3g1365 [Vigna unguiculata]|uniref:Uncharacterized protein n=1 Tax=Vigna unguiculata TaxID=3917 RepID=A0A4D6LE99_VIGUN|nr:hypothetical protein DEO72_LG3g1365 [Vigna unguiculata]
MVVREEEELAVAVNMMIDSRWRHCCSSVWRLCIVVAGRGATRGRWNAAMADALWRRQRRQMQVRGGARSSSCHGGREYGARWWCGGRRDWRRLCGGWKGN